MSEPSMPHALRDPQLTEIVHNWLTSIADEISVALIRGAYSTEVKESADASGAILDARGQLITQSTRTSILHAASLHECLPVILETYDIEAMRPGDVYVTNDPYLGGIHANDVAVLSPVFVDGRVRFFVGAIAHVADLGGVTAGGLPPLATDLFQEGVIIPPARLVRDGAENDDIFRVIAMNSRSPERTLGDLRALVGANNVGARRLRELLDHYGPDSVHGVVEDLLSYTEGWMREELAKLPPGRFTAEFAIDDDGLDRGRPLHVRIAMERIGSDLDIDLTRTDAQARGAINSSVSQTLSAIICGTRFFVDAGIPLNEGFLRPLRITLAEGTLVKPRRPAAVNSRAVTVLAVVETMLRLLAQHRPELATGCSGINHLCTIAGRRAGYGPPWHYRDPEFGGLGARIGKDGVDTSGAFVFGGRSITLPVEALETEYPVRYLSHRLIEDSGGPGTWRGGLGVERTLELLAEAELSVRADRIAHPPAGIAGGRPGRRGAWIVNQGRRDEVLLEAKQMGVQLRSGDTFTIQTSGGGGLGDPIKRDAALVAADVAARKVSPTAAERDYGVVFEDGSVDEAATERLRRRRLDERMQEAG